MHGRAGPRRPADAAQLQVAELAQELVQGLPSPLDRSLGVACRDRAAAEAVQARLPGVRAFSTADPLPAVKNLLLLGLREDQVRQL